MARLKLTPLALSRFHYDKVRKLLSAEASDFGPAREGQWWLQRIYDDACDVGIAVHNKDTGRTEVFYLHDVKEDGEGDIQAWSFRPLNEKLATVKEVIIFND